MVSEVTAFEPEVMKLTEVRQQFSNVVDRVYKKGKPVLVEKSGIPVVAVVSVNDLKYIEHQKEKRAELDRALTAFSKQFEDIPLEELEREIERALAEARAELREERSKASGS